MGDTKKDNTTNVKETVLKNSKFKSLDKTDVHIYKEKTRKNILNSAKVANKVEINKYIVWKSVTNEKSEKMCVNENKNEKKDESNNKLKEIKFSTWLDRCLEKEKEHDNKDIKEYQEKSLERESCIHDSNTCADIKPDKVNIRVEKGFEVKEKQLKISLTDINTGTHVNVNEQFTIERCEQITKRIEELSEQIKERDREIKEIQEIELNANRPIKQLIKEIELIEEGIKEIDVAKEVEKDKCENLMRDNNIDIPDSKKNNYLSEMQS